MQRELNRSKLPRANALGNNVYVRAATCVLLTCILSMSVKLGNLFPREILTYQMSLLLTRPVLPVSMVGS